MKKFVPVYEGELRKHSIQVPRCISECSGIRIFGRRIKSLVFSTDVAIIKNINADAVIAVYPFTPQPAITQAILSVSEVPVFAGVGGGLTNGQRSASIAAYAEHQGAFGLVCNTFITEEAIRAIKETVEIPLVYTVCILFLVVCALLLVIAIFCPISLFISVDFPTFGLPMMDTKPDLYSLFIYLLHPACAG